MAEFTEVLQRQNDQMADLIRRGRERINKAFATGNNIETLMSMKVEEFILLEEQPLPIAIGKKTIFVGNFTYQNEHNFFRGWGEIIALLQTRLVNMEINEDRRKDLLEKGGFELLANGKYLLEFLYLDKWIFNRLAKLLKKTLLKQQAYFRGKTGKRDQKVVWENCSWRYFKNNVTKEQLIQIAWLIYLFNFDAEKKNLSVIMNRLNMKALVQTYMYNWLRNLGGMIGKFAALQAPSVDSVFADSPSNGTHQGPKKPRRQDPGLADIEEPTGGVPAGIKKNEEEKTDDKPIRETPKEAIPRPSPASRPR